jgi:mono/diheme cytochrome c family protein
MALPAAADAAQAPFPLKSETVTLPTSTRSFPGGAAADPVSANCVICHSAGMVLNQPPLSKAAWEAEVRKMINVYKAPIPDADVAPIVAYLMQIKGAN